MWKTSLLVALSRMRNPNAFAEGYRVTGYDKYENSKITYDYNGTAISYTKMTNAGQSHPKRGKEHTSSFPLQSCQLLNN